MKILLATVLFCLTASAGQVTFAWDASVSSGGVAGYNLYYGPSSLTYTNVVSVGNNLSVNVYLRSDTDYFFAVTAYDSFGVESDFSKELEYFTVGWDYPLPIRWQIPVGVEASNFVWSVEMSTNLSRWQTVTYPYLFDQPRAYYRLKGTPK